MGPTSGRRRTGTLTAREREILGMLAKGMSGAEIAAALVLSPETVRTHVRNAMAKLGASTRSQAVVMAMRAGDIGEEMPAAAGAEARVETDGMLDGLAGLHDLESAVLFLADEDGLSLGLAASSGEALKIASPVPLGDGPIGRVALERRTQLVPVDGGNGRRSMVAAPMIASGRLVGVLGLGARASRPTGRAEILLIGALATRLGEIVAAPGPASSSARDRPWTAFARPGPPASAAERAQAPIAARASSAPS